jgi:hypothetical protein
MQMGVGGGAINKKSQNPVIIIFSGRTCKHPVEKPNQIQKKSKEKDEEFAKLIQNVPRREKSKRVFG